MRKIYSLLLCALILAEAVLLYGLYDQYETLAAEKNAVERRAEVLKTLFDQTEKELETEKSKWQAEKQALLSTQRELKTELAEKNAGTAPVFAGLKPENSLLPGVYAQLILGADQVIEGIESMFQGIFFDPREKEAPDLSETPSENGLDGPLLRDLSPIELPIMFK